MEEYNILLKVLEDVDKIDGINEFRNFPDVYSVEMKNKFIIIMSEFLNLSDKYRTNHRIICTSLMFNWLIANHVKSKLFINEHPKFKKVVKTKIDELGYDMRMIGCKYWKDREVYIKYLL